MVGLCHSFAGVCNLAATLGLDRERLPFEIPVVNHTVFLTHAYHDGEDVFPLLDAWIEREASTYNWKNCPPSDYLGPVTIELAALGEGSHERLLEPILADPWTRSLDQATALLDDILAMPGHESLREWYR